MSTTNTVPNEDQKKKDKNVSQIFDNPRVKMIASILGDKTYLEGMNQLEVYTNRVFVSNTTGMPKLDLKDIGDAEAELMARLKSKHTSQLPIIDKETMIAVVNIIEAAKKNLFDDDYKKLLSLKGQGLTDDQKMRIERQTLVGYITRMSALLFPTKGEDVKINKALNDLLVLSAGEYTRNNLTNSDELYNRMIKKYQESFMIKKGNEYFSKDSAYTAEYIINDILSDTNYKFLGDVGKQFLQEKINALPDNPKKTALQDQFNIQVLNISQKTHAENPPLQESARNATSSSTKIDTPQTEIIKKLVSSAGLLHQLKNAVLIAWNIGRELIFGKQDKTSARSDPSRPETAKNSVNAAQEPPAKNKTIGSIVSGMMSSAKNFLSTAIGFKPATKTEAVMTVTAPIITSAPVAPPTTTLPADTTSSKKHSTSSILSLLDGKNCNVSNAASKSLKERIKEIDKLITSQIEYVKLSCNHFSHPDVADDLKEHIRSLHALKQQAACSGPKDQAHITNALQEIQLKIANEINTSPSNSTYKTIMENVQKEELTDKGVIPKAITEQHSIAVRGANSVVEAIHSGIKRSF